MLKPLVHESICEIYTGCAAGSLHRLSPRRPWRLHVCTGYTDGSALTTRPGLSRFFGSSACLICRISTSATGSL